MDPITLTIIGIALSVVIGVPALYYQRRQTRLAEAAHEAAQVEFRREHRVDVLARIRAAGKMRIGLVHYPPFVVVIGNEEPSGLYVNLIREFCKGEGIAPIFEHLRFSSAVDAVRDDEVDIVLSIFQTFRRSRTVDFCVFMHTISVSGIVRGSEKRIMSQTDLLRLPLSFVVCEGEIGHELLEDALKVNSKWITIIDTSNVADIIEMVAARKADIAIADSLSCQHGLAARGLEGPKLKPVLRRRPLFHCLNGIMIGRDQSNLANWLEKGVKPLLLKEPFSKEESTILEEYNAIISKI